MTAQDQVVLALKGREATAKELRVDRGTLRRLVVKDLARVSGQQPSNSTRPQNKYKLTAKGATRARKLEKTKR